MVDLNKIIAPDPEIRYAVIKESFDDSDSICIKSYISPLISMSNNSTLLKTGFSSKEEATEWMENYKKDPSICNVHEDIFNGAKALAKVIDTIEDSDTYCIEQDDWNDPSTAHVVSTLVAYLAPTANNTFLFTKFKTKKEAEDWLEVYKKDPIILDKDKQKELYMGWESLSTYMKYKDGLL